MDNRDQIFMQRSIRWLIIAVVSASVLLALLWLLKAALTPLAVAFVLAYLLDPLIDRFEARRVPRSLAIFLLLAPMGAALAALALFLLPRLQRELVEFSSQLPVYWEAASQSLGPALERTFGVELPGTLREGLERLRDGEVALPVDVVRDFLGRVVLFFTGTIQALVGLVVIPVIAFYLLVEFDAIKSWLLSYIPRNQVDWVVEKARTIDGLMSSFIRGQLSVCALLGLLYAVGFSLIGIPLAVVIGVAAGLLAIIPYVGGAVALIGASGVCLFEFGLGLELMLVVGWYALVQAFEGFVLTPRIVGGSLGLHPVTVIVALLIGADLLGFLGLLVAVPVAAVLQVLLLELGEAYRQSTLYSGDGGA